MSDGFDKMNFTKFIITINSDELIQRCLMFKESDIFL